MSTLSQLTIPVKDNSGAINNQTFDLPQGGSGGASAPEAIGIGYGTCSTAYTTTAKAATLSNYVLTKNGIVAVKFTNAVNANATLNINSKGAKPIYYRGRAILNNIIKAGDIATFVYDGTNYQLISIDTAFKAAVNIKGDENAVVTIKNTTYGVNDSVSLDSDGVGSYIVKLPGTYIFSVPD